MTHSASSAAIALVVLAACLLAGSLFLRLGEPLLWADEAETAMFGERVLDYGYPKVHGERNVVYQFGPNIALGVKEGPDAYIGTTWGQFYFAAPGLAWARGTDDFACKTWRVRLPFAAAGAMGIGIWLWALLPLYRAKPRRAAHLAALFLLLAAVSVSLVLHLREARYYALVVLLGGLLIREHLQYVVFRASSFARWSAALALVLVVTFHVFFQAFFAFALTVGAERLVAILRGRAAPRELMPFAIAGLVVAPALVWFETFENAARFSESFALGPAGYLDNLSIILTHLARHEFLLPALLARAVAQWSRAGNAETRQAAGGLLLFAVGFVLVGCLNPLPLERYFVVVSPALFGALLVDALALVARARKGSTEPRRAAGIAAGVAIVMATLALRIPGGPAVAGHISELIHPARGPIDFAVPYLAERFDDTRDLVIATNYEEYAFMYYLDSHVIVGLSLNNLKRERSLLPDVVIPRRRWPRSLDALGPFVRGGKWEEVRLPVEDVHFNNIPALSTSRFIPAPHRFETPGTRDPDAQLLLYLRAH